MKSKGMHIPKRPVLLLCACLLLSPAGAFGESFFTGGDADIIAGELAGRMGDLEALGQVIMLGYTGTLPSEEILTWIREKKIGGVKIFGWNVGSLSDLASSIGTMQRAAVEANNGIPLLVATDQEGGWVRHVKEETSITAGNLAIGATGLPYDAYYSGYYIGKELKALGINMNFAPTVDVYTNPGAHVIGPRAFSEDPLKTAELAVAYFHGLEDAGIISTAKHFPGHGSAGVDSHGKMPIINKSLQELQDCELVPYRFLIREGIPAVMCGHLAFPEITGEPEPATISSYFQTELLRNKLGFDGISITDDLLMNGVALTGYTISEITEKALAAGNDIVLISPGESIHRKVWRHLYAKMKEDDVFRARIYEAAERVLRTKLTYLRREDAVPLIPEVENIDSRIPDPEGKEFFFDLACRSVSVHKKGGIPLDPPKTGEMLLAGQFRAFLEEGKKRFPEADTYYFPYDPFYAADIGRMRELASIIGDYSTVVFCLANPNSMEMLMSLEEGIQRRNIDIVVFSVLTPVYLSRFPWVESSLAVYGLGRESFQAGFAVLAGDYYPEGKIPIQIERLIGTE
jgi:beta-N-acetylhexosaminidase